MRKALCALLAALALSCNVPAQNPEGGAGDSGADATRALARGVVESAETVWLGVSNVCLESQDAALMLDCKNLLIPLRDTLIASGVLLDTWNAASQASLPCAIRDISEGVSSSVSLLSQAGVPVPVIVNDTLSLIAMLGINATCVDAGAADAAPKG